MLHLKNIKFKKIIAELEKTTPATRRAFFKEWVKNYPVWTPNHFLIWWWFYFSDDFKSELANFHYEWIEAIFSWKWVFIEGFRWSIKTAIVIATTTYRISNNLVKFVVWKSFEDSASRRNTTTIARNLMNPLLEKDYWILFSVKWSKEDLDKKSTWEFDTKNWVKVLSNSLWEKLRWANSKKTRPDLLILDDIDVDDSVNNVKVIDKNYQKLTWETFWALDKEKYQIIFLWNTIKNDWLVPRFRKEIKNKKKYWEIFWQPLFDEKWKIVWDFFTPEMVEKLKATEIETAFWQNYLLKPAGNIWTPVFKQEKIQELEVIEKIRVEDFTIKIETLKEEGTSMEIFWFSLDIFSEEKDVLIWVDVASWKGWDYSVIKLVDYDQKPIARFRSNTTEPYQLAHVLNKILEIYNPIAKIWIESNNHWIWVIWEARQFWWYKMLYREKTTWKVHDKTTKNVWFNTNWKSKYNMINDFSKLINSKSLALTYNLKWELENYYIDDKWSYNALSWFYDDEIIASAIAYQMRKNLIFT